MIRPGSVARFGCTTVLVIVLLGCVESRTHPELHLEEGQLNAPDGRYELVLAGTAGRRHTTNPSLMVYGAAPAATVTVELFMRTPQVLVTPNPIDQAVEFDLARCFYEDEAERRTPIGISQRRLKSQGGPGAMQLLLLVPGPLAEITLDGYAPLSDAVSAIRRVKGQRHGVHIAFTVDDKPYTLDMRFELDVDRSLHWKVPGTP